MGARADRFMLAAVRAAKRAKQWALAAAREAERVLHDARQRAESAERAACGRARGAGRRGGDGDRRGPR
jgi:hypothetical protein